MNKIEITDLVTGQTISHKAVENFSTSRIVVSSFNKINSLMQSMLKELGISSFRLTPVRMLIQQVEKLEGGISDIESRALRDICEQAGAKYVTVITHPNKLTNEEAMLELTKNK